MDTDVCTGAANHRIVVSGAREWKRIRDAVGRKHGSLHHLCPLAKSRAVPLPPGFWRPRTRALKKPCESAPAWLRRLRRPARLRSLPFLRGRGMWQSTIGVLATPGTGAGYRTPRALRDQAGPRAD